MSLISANELAASATLTTSAANNPHPIHNNEATQLPPNCDPSNNIRNRHSSANGTCQRQGPNGDCGTITRGNGDVFATCPHGAGQVVQGHYPVDHPPQQVAPVRVISDHVQFLITEKQKLRDSNDGDQADINVESEQVRESEDRCGQKKTNLNDTAGDEQEDWASGKHRATDRQ